MGFEAALGLGPGSPLRKQCLIFPVVLPRGKREMLWDSSPTRKDLKIPQYIPCGPCTGCSWTCAVLWWWDSFLGFFSHLQGERSLGHSWHGQSQANTQC